MQIQLNTTYICRDGSEFRASSYTGDAYPHSKTYAVCGYDEHGRITWRSIKGRFDRKPHRLDVVAVKVN